MKQTQRFVLAALTAVSLSFSTGVVTAEPMLPSHKIMGHWRSEGVEKAGQVYATRSFLIGPGHWGVEFRTFADDQGKLPLFTIRVKGVYVVGGPSAKVPGAFEGIFPAQSRSLTADSPEGVKMFAEMGCVLEQGKAQPLTERGCGFVPSLMQAMGEYDLVALKDGKLFFGDRSGDLNKARPEMLTPYPLTRQHGFKP